MKKIIALFVIVLTSCEIEHVGDPYISPLVEGEVAEFIYYAELYGITLDLAGLEVIVDEMPQYAGLCQHTDKRVIIDITYYTDNVDNRWNLWKIVWHELGHCLLKREHKNAKIGSIPQSLMSTQWHLAKDWHKGYYIDEMFAYTRQPIKPK